VFAPDLIDHNAAPDAASGIDGMRASIAAVRDGFTDTQHRVLFHEDLARGRPALAGWGMASEPCSDLNCAHGLALFT